MCSQDPVPLHAGEQPASCLEEQPGPQRRLRVRLSATRGRRSMMAAVHQHVVDTDLRCNGAASDAMGFEFVKC